MGKGVARGGPSVRLQVIGAVACVVVGWLARDGWAPACLSQGGAHDLRARLHEPSSPEHFLPATAATLPLSAAPPPVAALPPAPVNAMPADAQRSVPPPAWKRGSAAPPVVGLTREGFYARIRDWGFNPRTILDVGANQGDWAKGAWANFGGSSPEPPRLLMFEGSPRREPDLDRTGFPYVISVVGRETKFIDFYDNPVAHTGNSVLREQTHHFASTTPTRVPMRTLDELAAAAPNGPVIASPAILKLDVQGYEIEVLRGATRTLEAVEVVVLETAVVQYNAGAPLTAEVMGFMHSLGFVVFDMLEVHHSHGAVVQLDFAFVKRGSQLIKRAADAAQLTLS